MKYKSYTENELTEAIETSISKRQVLIKLGLAPLGGNYDTINRAVERLGLDISHFKGQGWNKGIKAGPKRLLEDYLNNEFFIQSYKLKNRLLRENVFERKCYKCNNTEWMGKDIPLELEHIDGDNKNNNLKNLMLLCPNCHAQTDTYRRSKNSLLKK